MKLIVGLGNPGEKYKGTCHNLGFMVLDEFASSLKEDFKNSSKAKAKILKKKGFILVKPLSFMNNSGLVVSRLAQFYKIKLKDIWVVYDDVDLKLGVLKIKEGGGAAGHKGVESIIRELGSEDFVRFRMGIDKQFAKAGEIVLDKVPLEEAELQRFIKKTKEALEVSLEEGIEKAANLFNTNN